MSHRTIARLLRRRGALLALPAAVAALTLASAPAALADSTCNGGTTANFISCISTANGAGAGFTIIQIGANFIQPTTFVTITGHVEITGPPSLQLTPNTGAQDPQLNGGDESTATPSDFITVADGATVIFKALDMDDCGDAFSFACVRVNDGGVAEFDNSSIESATGEGVGVNAGGTLIFNNSSILDGTFDGVEINTASGGATPVADFNNATIFDNDFDGLNNAASADVNLNNTVIADNNENVQVGGKPCASAVTSAVGSFADASGCGSSVTVSTDASIALGFTNFGGGPTEFSIPGDPNGGPADGSDASGSSSLKGAGNPLTCPLSDQRFFLGSYGTGGRCDVGAYQSTGTKDTEATGPTCAVSALSESSNPSVASFEQVTVTDPGSGVGPDVITNASGTTGGSTFTGTIAWPVITGTLLDETSPSQTPALDFPSTSGYVVTATKAVGDTTANDTKWQFDATDWLGNLTFCH